MAFACSTLNFLARRNRSCDQIVISHAKYIHIKGSRSLPYLRYPAARNSLHSRVAFVVERLAHLAPGLYGLGGLPLLQGLLWDIRSRHTSSLT